MNTYRLLFFLMPYFLGVSTSFPLCYFQEASLEDIARIAAFCTDQKIDPQGLLMHLSNQGGRWGAVAIEEQTEEIKGLALMAPVRSDGQAAIDYLYTEPGIKGLTESLLRYVLAKFQARDIKNSSLPAQVLFRSGIRTINTGVQDMLKAFFPSSINYIFYPAQRFINPDAEAIGVMQRYLRLQNTRKGIFQPDEIHTNNKRELIAACLGDVVVGVGAVIYPAPDLFKDKEANVDQETKLFLTTHNTDAYLEHIALEEGFQDVGLYEALLQEVSTVLRSQHVAGFFTIANIQEKQLLQKEGFQQKSPVPHATNKETTYTLMHKTF